MALVLAALSLPVIAFRRLCSLVFGERLGSRGAAWIAAAALLADTLEEAAPGKAPKGLGNTGEATFNRLQSGLGVPCVSLPGFVGPNGLPLGVQVTGAFGDDYRVLGWAKWIGERVGEGR